MPNLSVAPVPQSQINREASLDVPDPLIAPESESSGQGNDAPMPKPRITDHSLYFNREMSWLAFNERVLNEAADERWPLLERLKFFSIFFSNLDEFFMIRVSLLHERVTSAVIDKSPDGLTAEGQLIKIGTTVRSQLGRATRLLQEDLLPRLEANGIRFHRWEELDEPTREAARQYFRSTVFPVLTPLVVDPVHPFPFLSNLSLSLAVEACDPTSQVIRFARVKVPEILSRFIRLEGLDQPAVAEPVNGAPEMSFLPLEELIRANLHDLFPGMEIVHCHPFRVTRDMDIDILEEEADDLLSVINRELRRRKFGAPVRLELSPAAPDRIRRLLVEKLEIEEHEVYESPGPLGAASFFSIATLPSSELRDAPLTPAIPPRVRTGNRCLFDHRGQRRDDPPAI